jgi:hypothetical protein
MSGIFASTVQPDNALPLSGAVYVFERAGASWPQRGYLKASNVGAGAGFGTSVGIAGGMLVVGAPGEAEAATGSGACYGFR